MQKSTIAFAIAFAMVVAIVITRYSSAAESQLPGDSATSQVLITEIRELRRALNDYTVVNSKTQITLERLKFQQLRVDHLSDEKENMQIQIEDTVASYQQMEDVAKSLEKQAATESDPTRRMEIEREQKNTITVIEQHKKREQRLRERQLQLLAQLQSETTALNEQQINLEKLEKIFGSKSFQGK